MIWLPENLFCKAPESIVNFDFCRLEQPKTLSRAAFALALVRLMKFAAPSFFFVFCLSLLTADPHLPLGCASVCLDSLFALTSLLMAPGSLLFASRRSVIIADVWPFLVLTPLRCPGRERSNSVSSDRVISGTPRFLDLPTAEPQCAATFSSPSLADQQDTHVFHFARISNRRPIASKSSRCTLMDSVHTAKATCSSESSFQFLP